MLTGQHQIFCRADRYTPHKAKVVPPSSSNKMLVSVMINPHAKIFTSCQADKAYASECQGLEKSGF